MKTSIKISAFAFLLATAKIAEAQVGIGTDNPHTRALLHLHSTDKGLIIPTLTTGEIDAMTLTPLPANGTMVYNSDSNEVYVYFNSKWNSLTPLKKEHNQATTNKGRIRALNNTVDVRKVEANTVNATTVNATNGNGIVPIGGIIMWSGTTPPAGWALCDGTNNTPDLRGRFVVGYNSGDADYDNPGNYSTGGTTQGDQAGLKEVTLNVNQIPAHNHGVNDPGHYHNLPQYVYYHTQVFDNDDWDDWDDGIDNDNSFNYTNTAWTGITIQNTGGGQAHENRPPYYALAYIMRKQ